MEDFPVDVLQPVFEYLNIRDRLSAALVSRTWHQVANQKKFLQDITVSFGEHFTTESFTMCPKMTRSFRRFKFIGITLDEMSLRVLENLKEQVTHLKFNCCKFERPLNLNSFPDLECLSLWSSEHLAFKAVSPLFKMTTLSVDVLTDDQFMMLCNQSPNLEMLEIRKPYNRINPNVVLHCLRTRYTTLSSLVLDGSMDLSTFSAMARIPGLNLQKLSLINCAGFDDIKEFITSQQNLKYLDLRIYLEDEDVRCVCTLFPHIQTLSLHCCDFITNAAVYEILKLKQLKRLCLDHATEVTEFTQILKQSSTQLNLASLNLSVMINLDDNDVLTICDHFPNLVDLYLESCYQLTDISIIRVFKLPRLRTLCLFRCDRIPEHSFTKALEDCCCHLKELDVSFCHHNAEFVEAVCERFPDLEVLGIGPYVKQTERMKCRLEKAKVKNYLCRNPFSDGAK